MINVYKTKQNNRPETLVLLFLQTFPTFVQVLSGLNDLRQSKTLCDVNVIVGEREFPIHKCVLAASSNYFKVNQFCLLLTKIKTS
jgi:hypothetical protein